MGGAALPLILVSERPARNAPRHRHSATCSGTAAYRPDLCLWLKGCINLYRSMEDHAGLGPMGAVVASDHDPCHPQELVQQCV
jgi:hypothetical protein